ncbi:recombinase family protein [Streptomyces sp. NPDC001709]
MTSTNSELKPGMRALLMARVSKQDDRSTSIPRQIQQLRSCQRSHDWVTAGEVTDQSVSGALDPAERPQLGPWLTPEGLAQWDVMAVTTQDRLGRDDMHFFAFVHLILTHSKYLVILDDPSFDIATPTGRLVAYAKATQAAEELRKIRIRCADTRKWLRDNSYYGGGQTPAGYLAERPHEDAHAVLVAERVFRGLLRAQAERVWAGAAAHLLTLELNEARALTWRDRQRQIKREAQAARGGPVTAPEPKGTKWKAGVLTAILRSPAIAGYLVTDGQIHRLPNGEPAMLTEHPILSDAEWRRTVRALDARSRPRTIVHTGTAGEASGIGCCQGCGSSIYHQQHRRHLKSGRLAVYRYYRCTAPGLGIPCPAPAAIRAEELEGFYGGTILGEVGELPEVMRMQEEGNDPTREIEDLTRRLKLLEADFEAGRFDDDVLRESFFRMSGSISSRIARLRAEPVRPPRVWYESTGRTLGAAWTAMETPGRREFLYSSGVRLVLWRNGHQGGAPGVAVRLGGLREMAENLRGLPPVETARPPIALHNVSKVMYLEAVKAGRFAKAPAKVRL